MYFEANKRKELNGEDILVQYVRILEGYSDSFSQIPKWVKHFRRFYSNIKTTHKRLYINVKGRSFLERPFCFLSTHALSAVGVNSQKCVFIIVFFQQKLFAVFC